MAEKILVAFDFDHTIVDGNSDTYVRDLFLNGVRKCGPEENWTLYMQHIFHLLHQKNVAAANIVAAIESLPPTEDMLTLLQNISRPDCEVIIISDANSFFIKAWLESKKVSHTVNCVYSNPAYVDPTGLLNIAMYHTQDWCTLCERNLCKGEVLMKHIHKRSLENIKFSRIIYVGDGRNDYCPCLKLSSTDFVFARSGYYLEKLLKKIKEEEPQNMKMKAEIHIWTSAQDILSILCNCFSVRSLRDMKPSKEQ